MKSPKLRSALSLLLSLSIVFSVFAFLPAAAVEESDARVYEIRVEDLVEPIGIDSPTPVFTWKMQSDVIGAMQTAYQVVVTKASDGTVAWDSGWVESDVSVGITYAGDTLESATKYNVEVSIKDQDGNVASSSSCFTTGLYDPEDWDGAQWISNPVRQISDTTEYTIDVDIILDKGGLNFYSGVKDELNNINWNFYVGDSSKNVYLRPYFYENGKANDYPGSTTGIDVPKGNITEVLGYNTSEIKGKQFHFRVEVDGATFKASVGPNADEMTSILEYTYTKELPLYSVAFRNGYNDIARCDNLLVTGSDGGILYQNDFSDEKNPDFTGGEIVDGMLKVNLLRDKDEVYMDVMSDNGAAAPAYRKEFNVAGEGKTLKSAMLFTSAQGGYDTFINGERVGNQKADGSVAYDELKPGFTQYYEYPNEGVTDTRLFYHSYDVTWMLQEGDNAISAYTTLGWWQGRTSSWKYGPLAFRAALQLTYSDGSTETVVTDESWKVYRASPMSAIGLFCGEIYDSNVDTSWKKVGYDDSGWHTPDINNYFSGTLSAMTGSPITVREDLELSPKSITVYNGATGAADGKYGKINVINTYGNEEFTLNPGETAVVDLGQNHAGWEYFEAVGAKGTEITIRHGEMLNDNEGLKSRGNDGPEGSVLFANLRYARATTNYIMNGEGVESYHPSTTYYGYRYMEITVSEPVTFKKITGQVVTSVEKDTGSLETSDASVNQLISNIRWGMYSNYLSVPTDCPQRDERQGWTADTQSFSAAGCYMGYSKSFLMKFLQDMRDSQNKTTGVYPEIAPFVGGMAAQWGVGGWTDCGIILPYNIYRFYGDTTVIREHWDSMRLYMDNFLANTDKKGPNATRGDWVSLEGNTTAQKELLSVAYYAWDAMLMSKMATAIGETEAAAHYQEVYEIEKEFFQEKYVNADGTLNVPQQTSCLYALYLDLLPNEESVAAVTDQLITNIRNAGNKMQTGFLGTEIILNTLTKIGRSDVAYNILLSHDYPGWLYSVDQGATTMWERWNSYTTESGFAGSGMNSFNHYSYGSVGDWMFNTMGGINNDDTRPGFKHIILSPETTQKLSYVNATYDSSYGEIVSNWTRNDGVLTYEATIPANTTATIKLPVEEDKLASLTVNGKAYDAVTKEEDGLVFTGYADGVAVFDAVACSFKMSTGISVIKHITVQSENGPGIAKFSLNGSSPMIAPKTFEVKQGDTLTLTAVPANDVDYAVTNWTDEEGNVIAEGDTLNYVVEDDATITANSEWVGMTSIAIGAKVSGEQLNQSWPVTRLTDGVLNHWGGNSGWSSGKKNPNGGFSSPATAVIDLGCIKEFNRFHLYPRTDALISGGIINFPDSYTIAVSYDGVNYTTVYSVSPSTPVPPAYRPAVVELDKMVSARYIKLTVNKVNRGDEYNNRYVQLSEFGVYNTQQPTVRALDSAGEVVTDVPRGEKFPVQIVTGQHVEKVALFNENVMKMGLSDLSYEDREDGSRVWTAQMSIGTVGKGRSFTLVTYDDQGIPVKADATLDLNVVGEQAAVISASIDDTGVANMPVTLRVVTNTAATKIILYNEYGMNMGILSQSYQDVDGHRVWTVQTKIGTAGIRTLSVKAKNKYGDLSEAINTNSTTILPYYSGR